MSLLKVFLKQIVRYTAQKTDSEYYTFTQSVLSNRLIHIYGSNHNHLMRGTINVYMTFHDDMYMCTYSYIRTATGQCQVTKTLSGRATYIFTSPSTVFAIILICWYLQLFAYDAITSFLHELLLPCHLTN